MPFLEQVCDSAGVCDRNHKSHSISTLIFLLTGLQHLAIKLLWHRAILVLSSLLLVSLLTNTGNQLVRMSTDLANTVAQGVLPRKVYECAGLVFLGLFCLNRLGKLLDKYIEPKAGLRFAFDHVHGARMDWWRLELRYGPLNEREAKTGENLTSYVNQGCSLTSAASDVIVIGLRQASGSSCRTTTRRGSGKDC